MSKIGAFSGFPSDYTIHNLVYLPNPSTPALTAKVAVPGQVTMTEYHLSTKSGLRSLG